MSAFSTLGLSPGLQRAAAELGWTEPTPIQAAALPPALAGRDVLATAATGSGKTGAYAFAALQRIDGIARPRPRLPRVLVLVPMRRQNLLFSATFPPPVEALAQRLLHDPVRVDVGHLAAAVATR